MLLCGHSCWDVNQGPILACHPIHNTNSMLPGGLLRTFCIPGQLLLRLRRSAATAEAKASCRSCSPCSALRCRATVNSDSSLRTVVLPPAATVRLFLVLHASQGCCVSRVVGWGGEQAHKQVCGGMLMLHKTLSVAKCNGNLLPPLQHTYIVR